MKIRTNFEEHSNNQRTLYVSFAIEKWNEVKVKFKYVNGWVSELQSDSDMWKLLWVKSQSDISKWLKVRMTCESEMIVCTLIFEYLRISSNYSSILIEVKSTRIIKDSLIKILTKIRTVKIYSNIRTLLIRIIIKLNMI